MTAFLGETAFMATLRAERRTSRISTTVWLSKRDSALRWASLMPGARMSLRLNSCFSPMHDVSPDHYAGLLRAVKIVLATSRMHICRFRDYCFPYLGTTCSIH